MDFSGASPSPSCKPSAVLPGKPRPSRPEGPAAAGAGAGAVSPLPTSGGSVMPEGSLTSFRCDSSERRRSKEGRNAFCHAVRPSPAAPGDADCGLRSTVPNVAFHVSRRDDWMLFPSLFCAKEKCMSFKQRRQRVRKHRGLHAISLLRVKTTLFMPTPGVVLMRQAAQKATPSIPHGVKKNTKLAREIRRISRCLDTDSTKFLAD